MIDTIQSTNTYGTWIDVIHVYYNKSGGDKQLNLGGVTLPRRNMP